MCNIAISHRLKSRLLRVSVVALLPNRLLGLMIATLVAIIGCSDNNVSATSKQANPKSPILPTIGLERVFENIDIESPLWLTQAPVADDDWYLLEKSGRIIRFKNENKVTKSRVFLDISDRVDNSTNEGGLLSMAFHPNYGDNQHVYLSYTRSGSPLTSYVTRFKSLDGGGSLSANSEHVVLKVPQPYTNHNGGHIVFGADSYLYIGLGDGGSGGDPKRHGQNVNTFLGALLRIDVDKADPYAVPDDNPFVGKAQGLAEIYAWGLRNPWRWSFDRETQVLWLADVGQNNWEEVNIIKKGGNYGWNIREGTHCYRSRDCDDKTLQNPIVEYSHKQGCSITGGFVYRGKAIPTLQGVYLYGDYCSGTVWGIVKQREDQFQAVKLIESGLNIASFSEGKDGELYVLHLAGEIHKIVKTNKNNPTLVR
ncbi:MAG: PQQ-dependent sugar dehydrogenase [Gammaproteobacteria bacterium]|nr:PQQ-dependent sugar dehydrogenase [Gammaproteobacteria bacterium]